MIMEQSHGTDQVHVVKPAELNLRKKSNHQEVVPRTCFPCLVFLAMNINARRFEILTFTGIIIAIRATRHEKKVFGCHDISTNDGKPDIFLTMTCNPKWPEILKALNLGQEASDWPDVVARVFRAKLEDLKDQLFKRHVLGVVGAYVYVVEFQKRGLPHVHFLLIMTSEYKMSNPDHYDKMVCAEITKYPRMHEMVVKHMMHGPCGHLSPSSPCTEGKPKQCRWRYPRQFNEITAQGEDSHPLYRRRNTKVEVTVRQSTLDNRWVVPYNPKLLMMYNCHINVEICSSIKSVKYTFKYVYKGHDKQVIHIDPDGEREQVINEVKNYQDARYVSPPELVRFREDDTMIDIVERERHKRSMLTAFSRRLVYANPSEGERHYLRLLLSHVRGPTGFKDLYKVNGVLFTTFRKAALERGLIENDDSLSHCLFEACLFQFPNALRRLFVTILIYCGPGDVQKLWNDHYESLSEDYS
nr:uncharacterized protein [Tanacetum cinerariifolium]